MSKQAFRELLQHEIERIDNAHSFKRRERVINSFTTDHKAVIDGKPITIFNSNDYLGLRFSKKLHTAEVEASATFGSGPGAVRFISGTMKIHTDLEQAIAKFHGREDAMIFSSAFATNMAVIHCMVKGQSKDSLVDGNTLVVSDALNHRSIIDGIRVAGLPSEHKRVFKHLDLENLTNILEENAGKYRRVVVITDGIFSMLGEHQDIKQLQEVTARFDDVYEHGVITIVDDAHGVACFGPTGRGTEEFTRGKSDLLVGTFGKGFGADGGYVVGDKIYIDYLRESAATYIYSNPFSPGTAGAALASVQLLSSPEGTHRLETLQTNISALKERMLDAGFEFASESKHAIQPLLIGDAQKARKLADDLYRNGMLVTTINYPVVPPGRDEIRIQLSALHTSDDIEQFVAACVQNYTR